MSIQQNINRHHNQMVAEHQAHCGKNQEAYFAEMDAAGFDDIHEYEADLNSKAVGYLVLIGVGFFAVSIAGIVFLVRSFV